MDKVSGTTDRRPSLEKVKDLLWPGDTLVVWRLDRLGRSLRDLIETVREVEEQGAGFQSLQEVIDTTTPTGKLTFHLFGALAEFERNLIRERTQSGLHAARARGRLGGRRKALNKGQRELVVKLYNSREKKRSRKSANYWASHVQRYMPTSKPLVASQSRTQPPLDRRVYTYASPDGRA